jgi:pyruvate dehydrogenase phosphatase
MITAVLTDIDENGITALGDHTFKLKSIYASKIFLNTKPGFNVQTPVEEFIKRNHTPPYVSNEPGVEHRKIRKGTRGVGDRFIVMCSDGLTDLYKGAKDTKGLKEDERGSDAVKAASTYVRVVGAKLDESGGEENLALHLLRVGLGGDNSRSVSSGITVEMEERWMDDTTIQVLLL